MNYSEVKAVNNSLLSYLDPSCGGSPKKFIEEFNNPKRREEKDFQKYGTALHCYILEREKFEDTYTIIEFKEPSEPIKQIIDSFNIKEDFIIEEYRESIIKSAREINYYNNYKDDTLYNKIAKESIEYIEFLKETKDKAIINKKDKSKITDTYLNIMQHPIASFLINNLIEREYEVYTNLFGVEVKAKLDGIGMYISLKSKYIIDIKTTSKSPYQFKESFYEYHYGRQRAFYMMATGIENFYHIVCSSIDSSIVVYKNPPLNNFNLNDLTYASGEQKDVKLLLQEIKWQRENPGNNWKYFSWEVNNNYVIDL